MKQIAAIALLACLAAPATAQEAPAEPPTGDVQDGLNLLGEGAKLFLRGLADQMEPTLKDLADNMEPAMRALSGMIDDFNAYEAPERLPNGDIIIRRKPGAPPIAPAPNGDIEL